MSSPDVGQTLADVLQADGIDLEADSGWFGGSCPQCGGQDRFQVNPSRTIWKCRQCHDDWGDVIDYVRHRDDVDYHEACRRLRLDPDNPHGDREAEAPLADRCKPDTEPDDRWRDRAVGFYEFSENYLWGPDGQQAIAWLRRRGFTDETIRQRRLGLFPGGRMLRFQTAVKYPKWHPLAGRWRDVRCITIPWLLNGRLWGVRYRFQIPVEEWSEGSDIPRNPPKYKHLTGSIMPVYGADNFVGHRVAVITEGEFDAVLLHQEAGDLVGVATFGSADARMHTQAILRLLPLHRILLVLDADAAGTAGADRLAGMMSRAVRVQVPLGKDITEFRQAGGNLRQWVRYLLAVHGEPQPQQNTSGAGLLEPGKGQVVYL
ncbi:MAG TPA: toprim domain-containing protein [Candidatus Xenobia bacterium]